MQSVRLVVISDASPRLLWRLAQRVQDEVPGATVCGLVHARGAHPEGKGSLGERFRTGLARVGDVLLRCLHAGPKHPNAGAEFTDTTLVQSAQRAGWPIVTLAGGSVDAAADLLQRQQPDLCLALVRRSLAPDILAPPRLGSIVVNRLRSTDLDFEASGQKEIKLMVSRVQGSRELSCIRTLSLPIEPYDTVTSIALKTDLVGSDLLIESADETIREAGVARERIRDGAPTLSYLDYYQQRKSNDTCSAQPALRDRPAWRLLLISLLLSPYLILRNWYRRSRGRFPVVILVHHLISDNTHLLGMPTEVFFRQVEFLHKHYHVVSLSQAIEMLKSGVVRAPTVVLTFDDGYQENFLTLRSIIEATGIPVSLFVCTKIVEEQAEFPHDQARGQHNFNALSWDQVLYLSRNGLEIGSHTRSHFDCGSHDTETLRQELVGAKADLQRRLGQMIRFFGFPYGKPENMSDEAVRLTQSNYEYSLSCFGGENFFDTPVPQAHLFRKPHPADLWELELTLQGALDVRQLIKRALGWGGQAEEVARLRATALGGTA
jgi:peptidoglycan/xylan/chitin deacetylase (PgdA/CDA1 family)